MPSWSPAKPIKKCRTCGSRELAPILSLGDIYVSDFVTDRMVLSAGERHPLELVLCVPQKGGCGLLQLRHTVDPSKMYSFYYYHSGTNAMMRGMLADITREAEARVKLEKNDLVLDIGCNDGTLLRSYRSKELRLVGFDPAKNLIREARISTTCIINDYFNYEAFRNVFPGEKARVVTSIAMFYDLDDPNRFVSDVVKCLASDSFWIIQMSYLPLMLEQNAFDNICHEHLEYYSLYSLENLLRRHGLEVTDVELNDVNGGSFRIYIQPLGAQTTPAGLKRVEALRKRENKLRLDDKSTYLKFVKRVLALRKKVVCFIRSEVSKGKTVYAYGASTKGNTLLQYFGLDHTLIHGVAERNPDKFGKKTVGTMIRILSEEEASSYCPDYFLILPWHFLKIFLRQESEYLKSGGRFIVPLPQMKIIPPLKAL